MGTDLRQDENGIGETDLSRIEYCVMDPTGNITILVETPVETGLQPSVASGLMAREKGTEQVGFVSHEEGCDIALRMAGGEFCGNASMCAAVYAARKAGWDKADVLLHVSGSADPVRAEVEVLPDGSWKGTVNMPRPVGIENIDLPGMGVVPVVRFDGICHIILEERLSRTQAESYAREWCAALGADAVGLMFLDRTDSRLTPLVYVPAADTLCWENSCASGTTAVGAYLAARSEEAVRAELRQPGGSLTVEVFRDGNCRLSGTVKVLKHGSAAVECMPK